MELKARATHHYGYQTINSSFKPQYKDNFRYYASSGEQVTADFSPQPACTASGAPEAVSEHNMLQIFWGVMPQTPLSALRSDTKALYLHFVFIIPVLYRFA